MRGLNVFLCVSALAIHASGIYGQSSVEVAIDNPSEKSHLEGTLTMPAGKPRAALVLATGSGQQDRDETVFGHKPFKTIAEHLQSRGYAVLRLDDRGVGGSTGEVENATTTNFVSDISRATDWLDSALTDVPVGVLGHSEGGQIAYRIAAENPRCRFIITLAGPAWEGDSLVMAQCRALAVRAYGSWPFENNQRRILEVVKSKMPAVSARPIIMNEVCQTMGDAAKMPGVQEYITRQADLVLTPWYREFVRYNPAEAIAAVKVAWLAINGDLDTQVPSANLTTISQLCPTATVVELKGHNHLLQNAVTGLPQEYERISEDISEEALRQIDQWLDLLEF